MPSTYNATQYTYGSGASGTTAGGTSFNANLNIAVEAGADFTDETSWILFEALKTALTSVGWTVGDGDISLSKTVFDDTSSNGVPATKTFT